MVDGIIAKTLDEALTHLSQQSYDIVAGGTDMLIQNRSHTGIPIGFKHPVLYVNLIDELNYIKEDEANIYIGATTRLETILKSEITPKLFKDIIIEMASPGIRHTATMAGNIGNASPAGDSLVALYLYDAKVKCQSIEETRVVNIIDFIQGVRKIDLHDNELITEIIFPKLTFTKVKFEKVAPRLSDAISKLSFTGAINIEDGLVKDFRMAFGAVYMTVIRRRDLEEKYIGLTREALKKVVEDIVQDFEPLIKPIDDQRSNKAYRYHVALNLIRDFVNRV